uniref:Acetyl-CoA hydrolase n=1 Tax=Chromera velia CCMP2878 TaxID=1169474 RepID=A0A0G4G065_9ALVE|eukprot:Cvel_19564.t1-p1 / transcript=Cvel_19564.t1 / gene=Cvel_19564 / organism=Chromera_velia_CCMP2878 / gene_product=4-hydroxybutyrate coenzyme A transferase, putative / transcript_product=4-hydroxybutyrate coenzyme A transferase, putative / location=Cvel_scaffold1696:29501-31042(+) / protein_length=514 / sequence_SO=supercontig / SO=protein_coding / is_pseudo=false
MRSIRQFITPALTSFARSFERQVRPVASISASVHGGQIGQRRWQSGRSGPKGGRGPPSPPVVSGEEAISLLHSHDRIFLHGISCNPQHLLRSVCAAVDAGVLDKLTLYHLHLEGDTPHVHPKYEGKIRSSNLFIGHNCRQAVNEFRADFTPIFLSEIPLAFERGVIPLDAVLMSVSPPDKHGYCSIGPDCTSVLAAASHASTVIAQVNRHVPRTHGQSSIHMSELSAVVEYDEPLPLLQKKKQKAGAEEKLKQIGAHVAELVQDGSTLQTGIGGIPDAVLAHLIDHKDLGIHTEMFSDGVIPLIQRGAVNNQRKVIDPGKTVASFCAGSQDLFDFIDDNPGINFLPSQFVNSPRYIQMNPKVVAINSCLEVDLSGQIASDSVGHTLFSGVGGQVDFERGAALSVGGRPIIALPSSTSSGLSRIVPAITPGGGVVTTRAHAHWVVTEYGKVYLFGKNLRERAESLISIAHPDHRDSLSAFAEKMLSKFDAKAWDVPRDRRKVCLTDGGGAEYRIF